MKLNQLTEKYAEILRFLAGLFLCVVFIFFSSETKTAVSDALELCFGTLIPSLFPMLFISSLLSLSGCPPILARIFDLPMKKFFGLSGNCFLPVLLSLTQGFPIAVKTAFSGYSCADLTLREARTIALFFTSPGISFCFSVLGSSVFGSGKAGFSVLFSCVFSDILLCLLLKNHIKNDEQTVYSSQTKDSLPFSELMIRSCASSSSSITNICFWVILFSVFSSVTEKTVPFASFADILTALSEVTEGILYAGKTKNLALAAFISGFGGLCIFCQVLPELKKLGIRPLIYLMIRVAGGTVSFFTEKTILHIFPLAVSAAVQKAEITLSAACVPGSASLMVLCLIFMISLSDDNKSESISFKTCCSHKKNVL